MQKIIKFLPVLFFMLCTFLSCKKEENKVVYEGGKAPVLSATAQAVRLEPGEELNTAIKFNWTNPDYKLNTGSSSHDVNYILEMDTAGANFSSSRKFPLSISNDLSKLFTVGELNAILGNTMLLQLTPRRQYNIEVRIISSVAGGTGKLISNVFTFTAKPFPPPPKVSLPAAGNLWITGDAVASNWANPLLPPYDLTHKFTRLPSLTDYELLINMNATGAYKLIQTQGDWSTQYHMIAGGTGLAGSFDFGDANPSFPSPGVAGIYKLSFNFQLGTFTAVKQ